MKALKIMTILAGLTASSVSAVAAEADWYVGHLGEDVCVPVRGIHDDFTRARWGGSMRTPEDVAQKLREKGLRTEWKSWDTVLGAAEGGKALREHGRILIGDFPGRQEAMFFFDDKIVCRAVMDFLEVK